MSDESQNEHFDTSDIDQVIIGRVKPHIYAFSTNTVPNYLKVGDTYRPVKVRLDEWRKKYANLIQQFDAEATVSDDTFFRDYSIHDYLENTLGKERLSPEVLTEGVYYSNEFFKDANSFDIKSAIADIKDDFSNKSQKYQFYSFDDRPVPVITKYTSTGLWKPRPNQDAVIKNFVKAVNDGRTNLLLYAVMRFGKTFTSMCCANSINAKTVLIVSAKADVKEEWRMTIQSADNFKDFEFLDSKILNSDASIVKKTLASGKKAAIFLTLEDLQGSRIKDKHREIFEREVDLLLIDETHFGARAKEYGKVLRDSEEKSDDSVDFSDAEKEIKVIKSKVRLHLSGTPYRILMSSEFENKDIVGFYQASDILDEKNKWNDAHFCDIDEQIENPETGKPYQEWDNPYYGFPEMVRFAFTPSKRIRAKLLDLEERGVTSKLNKIFEPISTTKKIDGSHKKFVFSEEILDFLKVIDGTKTDDELFGFLDYDKINDGNLCRHMVFVLPYRASCDAMEAMLKDNKDFFKNLCDYSVINISGVDKPNRYKTVNDVKDAIRRAEAKNEKTITLTVNRMLTGSTVREWDTMLYLKDTSSPQEYDQSIFRLQNQFIEKYSSSDGDIIKYDKKPQTLLIDFSPNRVFAMQEERSLIYNAKVSKRGRDLLVAQIDKDIQYSPIIVLNKNRMKRIQAVDLLSAIDNYSRERGIYDEAQEIPIDFNLLNDDAVRSEIEKQGMFRGHQGFEILTGDDDDEIDVPDGETATTESTDTDSRINQPGDSTSNDAETKTIELQFKTYYSRILFYSALTNDIVKSLSDIIKSIGSDDNNARIAHNLYLDTDILKIISQKMDAFAIIKLDNTIARINKLSNDTSLTPLDRAQTAISRFDRLSDSEIVTNQQLCGDVLDTIDIQNCINILRSGNCILDIASKKAEFTVCLVQKLKDIGVDVSAFSKQLYSIPTSKLAYEFTRKIYGILGLDINCIADEKTSYDIVQENRELMSEDEIKQFFKEKGDNMHFDAIVGNPPYQRDDGGNGISASPIYQFFVEQAKSINPKYISMIIPSRWFTGGKGLDTFRSNMLKDRHIIKIVDYVNSKDCFPGMSVGGGICYFLRSRDVESDCEFTNIIGNKSNTSNRKLDEFDVFIRFNDGLSIVHKAMKDPSISEEISSRNPFGIPSNGRGSQEKTKNCYTLYSRNDITYIDKSNIGDNKKLLQNKELANNYKVLISRFSAEHAGEPAKDGTMKVLSRTQILKPGEICTDTYIVGGNFKKRDHAVNFMNYLNTKFARFLLLQGIASISVTKERFCFVPTQEFSKKWTDEMLYKKYRLTKDEIAVIEGTIR